MSSRVLEFFRQQDERFRGVPDAELTGFVAETYPDFLQDEEFLRSVKGYQQQGKLSNLRSEMQAVESDAGRLLGPQTGEKLADVGSRYVLEPVANIPATIGNLPAMAGKAVGLIPEEAPLPFERGKPVVSLPRFDQQEGDGKIKQYAKGAANALAGVAESLTTPENMMALPAAAAGAVTRGVAETAFAGIMAGMVPEAAQAAGEASVTGTPMEKAEAYTGLGAMAGLVAAPVPGMARRATEAGVLPVSKGEVPKVAARALDSAVKQGPAGNIGRPVTPILARIENIAETAPATAEVLKQVQTDVAKLPEGTPTELKPPVAPEPAPSKAPTVASIWDAFNAGSKEIATIGDVAAALAGLPRLPKAIRAAVDNYMEARKAEQTQYGERGGLDVDAGDALAAALDKHVGGKTRTTPEPSPVQPQPATVDVAPILSAATEADLYAEVGRLTKDAGTEADMAAIQQAAKQRQAEIQSGIFPEPVAEPRPTTLAELATYDVESAAMKALEAERKASTEQITVEKLKEQRDMLRDIMETRRANGQPQLPAHRKKLAEIESRLKGEEVSASELAGDEVFGHPSATSIGGYKYSNLIPIKVSDVASVDRKIAQAQKLIDELQKKIGTAEAVVAGRVPGNKKQSKAYLDSANGIEDKTVLGLLKSETVKELNRLRSSLEAEKAAEQKPAPVEAAVETKPVDSGVYEVQFESPSGGRSTVRVSSKSYSDLSPEMRDMVDREHGAALRNNEKEFQAYEDIKQGRKKITLLERQNADGSKSEYVSIDTPEKEFSRWALREDLYDKKYNDNAKELKGKLESERATEQAKKASEADAKRAEVEREESDSKAYASLISSVALPKGKRAILEVPAVDENGNPTKTTIQGTSYGEWFIHKIDGGKYAPDRYVVTHVRTGLKINSGTRSLENAKNLVRSILESKINPKFKSARDILKSDKAKLKQIVEFWDTDGLGKTPDFAREIKSQGLQVRRALENNRNRTEGGFITKEVFEDIVNLGRRLFRPGIDFASWSAAMVKSAGHRVKEFLEDAWDYIKGTLTSYDPDSGAYIANATRRKALQVIRGTSGALPKSIRDQQRITSGHRQATEERAMVLARDVRAAAEAAFPDAPDRGTSVVDDALSGRAPLSSLPTTRLQHSVAVLRQFIDSMSLAVASNPAVSETLGNAIKANLGSYWKRAYLAFDPEADWNYDSIVRKIKRGDADAKRRFDNMRDFLKRRNPEWDDGRIEAEMRSLVDRATEMTSGRAPEATTREWASNVSSLMQRKDLPIEVREWLGEITDPYAKVAVTAKWMAQFLARQDSMQVIADTGLRTGLFSNEKTGRYSEQVYPDELDLRAVKGDDGKPLTTEEKQIVAEFFVRTDKAHHPLRNLYTTKEMAAALREFESPNGGLPSVLSVLGRLWSGSVGLMKKGQVPLNPGSWNVNILGGVGINLVGGHWNPMLYKAAFRAIRHGGKARGDRPTTAEIKKAREDYMLAVRQGLMDAGVLQSEIRELSQAAIGGESPKKAWERVQEAFRSRQAPSVKDLAKAAWHLTDIPGELFISKPDNMFRMANFMGNLEVATKAFPDMTPEQRIAWATERATNTYQTYSKLPQSIRDLSKAGLLNTYIQFKVELMRNTFWVARYAMQDMRSGNPVLMKNGAKAMAGLTGVFAATYFLTGISRDASDLTPEQEEALRLFLAPWDRNEPLFHVGRDGNTFSYSPVSYLVPHAEFSKIVSAAAHSLDDPDRAMQELGQLAGDYFGPSSMTKPMVEAVANKRLDSGDEITRKEGSEGVQDRLNYFFQSTMVPRMYTMARDTIRGVMGIPGDYGKVNKPEDALLKMAAVRVRNVDMDRAVFFKLRELERRWQGARSEELKAERRWKDFPDKVAEVKAYSESKKQQLLVEYKKHVVAAKLLGVTDETIGKAERDLSIPKQLRAARWSEE